MKIRYSPVSWNEYAKLPFLPNTETVFVDENSVTVDGELYEFDDSVIFPDIRTQTNGVIEDAHREVGELYLTIRRFYTDDHDLKWDTGEYHEIHG